MKQEHDGELSRTRSSLVRARAARLTSGELSLSLFSSLLQRLPAKVLCPSPPCPSAPSPDARTSAAQMDHSSFYESLAIPESHPIQAGTLLLNSVTPVDDSREEEEGGEGITAQDEAHKGQSQSLGSPAWRIYAPGALLDSSGEAALRGSSASATPTRKGRGTATRGHKRKRSSVSSSVEESSTARPKSAAPVVPVPSLAELDHVVTNIFLRLEYALVNPSSSDYGDAHSGTHGALFRVYVVPLDAPGLNSKIVARKLKIRSTHNKLVAQKALHKVFHHLRYDYDEWQSGQLNTDAPMLLHRNPVRH